MVFFNKYLNNNNLFFSTFCLSYYKYGLFCADFELL